jgi:hypothetical protein
MNLITTWALGPHWIVMCFRCPHHLCDARVNLQRWQEMGSSHKFHTRNLETYTTPNCHIHTSNIQVSHAGLPFHMRAIFTHFCVLTYQIYQVDDASNFTKGEGYDEWRTTWITWSYHYMVILWFIMIVHFNPRSFGRSNFDLHVSYEGVWDGLLLI